MEINQKTINELRRDGYAVIVWTPEELGNASAKDVQDRLVELGHEVIDSLSNWTAEA